MQKVLEKDLFEPLRKFFIEQGYSVFGEVKGCDLVAQKTGHTLIVEMKTSFSLKLVYQAIDRQGLSEEIYVAIPRPLGGQNTKAWKNMIRLLKRLQLGLLTVALDSPLATVDVVLTPSESVAYKNTKKRKALAAEMEGRSFDENIGGICKQKIVTAYKEKAIELCCILEALDIVSIKQLRDFGIGEKQLAMLRSNVYGWYCRKQKGIYTLSEDGKNMLIGQEFKKLTEYYKQKWEYCQSQNTGLCPDPLPFLEKREAKNFH